MSLVDDRRNIDWMDFCLGRVNFAQIISAFTSRSDSSDTLNFHLHIKIPLQHLQVGLFSR